jgi:hypothetical protein
MTKDDRRLRFFQHLPKNLTRRSLLRGWVILLSVLVGWAITHLSGSAPLSAQPLAETRTPPIVQVSALDSEIDPVPPRYQLGQELYRENCATCHLAIPAAVLPTETWRQVLQDPEHYGRQLQPLVDPTRLLVWNYLLAFSRPQLPDEPLPYRIAESRYFRALHPTVQFSSPITLKGCVSCHPGASDANFRRLIPAWEKAS